MSRKKIPCPDINLLRKLIEEDCLFYTDAAKIFNVLPGVIGTWCRENNVKTKTNLHLKKVIPDRNNLEQKYLIEKLSCVEIAKIYETSNVTVKKWLKFYNIEIRTRAEDQLIVAAKFRGISKKPAPNSDILHKLYIIDHLSSDEIARMFDVSPSLVLQKWLPEYGIPVRSFHYESAPEREIRQFLKGFGFDFSTDYISGSQFDLVNHEYKIAIEFNGLYWHSEMSAGKSPSYHYLKFKICQDKNYRFISIFENEWNSKKEIIKSKILSLLGVNKKIFARMCKLSDQAPPSFFEDNHIQGNIAASRIKSLIYNGEVVAAISYGVPRFNKKYDYELYRVCTKRNTTVIGGVSRLCKSIEGTIISYSDLRYGIGKSLINSGFELAGYTRPNYFYTKNYKFLESRMKYQKHKLSGILEIYDEKLSEWENMKNNGYDRIFDCGNSIWVRK